MPEIGEVARIVSYLRKHAVGKSIASVKVQEDDIIYGKVGTSAGEFKKAMTGKKLVDVGQQGKYFWLTMSSPPHPCLHFGMTGWMKFSNEDTAYYKPVKAEEEQWPPRFWKFILEIKDDPSFDIAFIDARRLGRIRLLDCDAADIRKTTPLKENGPDPVLDKDILTLEWLTDKLRSKKVPVKALLLDQANISGVGNWVGDEVLYHAKIHPEQYSNTLNDSQVKQLHTSLSEVCTLAVETGADSSKFPDDWLMKHRWGKGKKDKDRLPNGEKIVFLKVGGRTSAVVPSVQKKTGPVAGDINGGKNDDADEAETSEDEKPAKRKKKENAKQTPKKSTEAKASKKVPAPTKVKDDEFKKAEPAARGKKRKPSSEDEHGATSGDDKKTESLKRGKRAVPNGASAETAPGRRRSTRVSGKS
ncbi:MAG: hypothetical protein M1819_000236 [Sarea resinae]|nr:MAG: hypothetical protein M1819_000236 [Sarea resinae]